MEIEADIGNDKAEFYDELDFIVQQGTDIPLDRELFAKGCANIAQSAREAALLEAARAVCGLCRQGPIPVRTEWWLHDGRFECPASAIHDLRKK